MKRKQFIKTCGWAIAALPFATTLLQSCQSIYYASFRQQENKLIIPISEFRVEKTHKFRDFVLVQSPYGFPICIYKISDNQFAAALLKCTHRGCELNVGGGIYSCPCHGSEFDIHGKVLEGPADQDLQLFKTTIENENIYIYLS